MTIFFFIIYLRKLKSITRLKNALIICSGFLRRIHMEFNAGNVQKISKKYQ